MSDDPMADARAVLAREVDYFLTKLTAAAKPSEIAAHLADALAQAGLLVVDPADRANVEAIRERDELRALFDAQWARSREADEMWRAEKPEERALVWPDLGVLLAWLMDRVRGGEAKGRTDAIDALRDENAYRRWAARRRIPYMTTDRGVATTLRWVADYLNDQPGEAR